MTAERAMTVERALLARPHLTVVSGEPDFDLRQIARIIAGSEIVDGRGELEDLLGRLDAERERAAAVTPKTLDLIGHTRSRASLVTLGGWMIDASNPATATVFRGLADREVLPRLGVHALRLLGCSSAGTAQGRATICTLADLLGIEVYGSRELMSPGHYDAGGFRDCWSFLLVSASELRRDSSGGGMVLATHPHPRVLDLDALPAITLGSRAAACSRRIASAQAAHQILQLVRRLEGAPMPGLAATPTCELALPSAMPGAYHIAHVLFDGAFLQVYPDGMAACGIGFPIEDAGALCRIIATLEPGPELSD